MRFGAPRNQRGAAIDGYAWATVGLAIGTAGTLSATWMLRRFKNKGEDRPTFLDVNQTSGGSLEVVLTYLKYYQQLFAERRTIVKSRAKFAVVATAAANSAIAVVGAIVTLTGWSGLAIASTALAGVIAVIAAWDGHFRHRDLWVQRSVVLQQLEEVLRDTQIRKRASATNSDSLAEEAMAALDRILKDDIDTWASIRKVDDANHPKFGENHDDGSTPPKPTE